ncbi:MAG: type IV pilus modification protein PilV [Gammaproteobacteria bacterium]|nr:type IV pilus modification protein PilV [Gammaproteobacteria bacterium]MBT3488209.1 type IV pilus modification protein PilV [Gammaproteobacteria bacterium]MBT3892440.1 type IV pilus modification protein PilV [Gammaproteobacteria bacterium]MBT4788253.1 type IV pilus modification protein PilV [Gammaproteobacteria bacterium]MBT6480136.1 type IV pilus modification protein PilV [Gammaproteobacteria bacterium]
MIETLIALFLLTTALFGFAALTSHALQVTQGAIFHDLATIQASSMVERVRANPLAISAGHYLALSAIPSAADCVSNPCSPEEIATFDFSQWNQRNSTLLPNGVGSITSTAGGYYLITIQWSDRAASATHTLHFSTP